MTAGGWIIIVLIFAVTVTRIVHIVMDHRERLEEIKREEGKR